ncbi:SDR family NAD(P)-dependent oxidoreductase [Agrobacterium sp. NPDC090283]|uniref:SDR family NAD(P)-dependent oxidoreductase n=1 Tax=Agrobacterium sp. NPDC090283 TaxID=3363920 RepID=UPI00383A0B5C
MSRIATTFGPRTTADEVVGGRDLSGLRAIVTGAASGIGVETARSLVRAGAEVTIAVRNIDAGERVADEIAASTGTARPEVVALDLADQSSVRAFADAWSGPLHLLINNAGVMAIPDLQRTPDGWEMQFATNHLGHFALALGLHDALKAAGGARIVSVASSGHHASPVMFDDIHYRDRPYDPWSAYGQSKTANVLFAVEATRRWSGDGIFANALMPGGIMTNLQKYVPEEVRAEWAKVPANKTPEQGASTTLVAALAPEFEGIGGRYLEDCNEAELIEDDAESHHRGVRRWALDPAAATRLWDASLDMIGPR